MWKTSFWSGVFFKYDARSGAYCKKAVDCHRSPPDGKTYAVRVTTDILPHRVCLRGLYAALPRF